MSYAVPYRLRASAAASLAASLLLIGTPFVFPNVAVVGAVAFLNWCLVMAVSYFALLPMPKWGTFSSAQLAKLKVWVLVFLIFTTAGWAALALATE